MAMALRIASPEQTASIAEKLSRNESGDYISRDDGTVIVTPAMSYFLHAGLCEAGLADASWELLRTRFTPMLEPDGGGTLWEEWWPNGTGRRGTFREITDGRSDAQTESAFFPGLFARYILGIEPTKPGLREIVLRHYPSQRLPRRSGAVPTPSGVLRVDWQISPDEFLISLGVPNRTSVRIDLESLKEISHDQIIKNQERVSLNSLKDGFIHAGQGEHQLRIQRLSTTR